MGISGDKKRIIWEELLIKEFVVESITSLKITQPSCTYTCQYWNLGNGSFLFICHINIFQWWIIKSENVVLANINISLYNWHNLCYELLHIQQNKVKHNNKNAHRMVWHTQAISIVTIKIFLILLWKHMYVTSKNSHHIDHMEHKKVITLCYVIRTLGDHLQIYYIMSYGA